MGSSHAALFEDGDARRQINIVTEALRANQKAVLELSVSNDKLVRENQELRGQIEELKKYNEELGQSLKTYYTELNTRLTKLEPVEIEIEGVKGSVQPGEKEAYDDALKNFQSGDLLSANTTLTEFINRYPLSPYGPLAKYWLVNTQYAQKDYKTAITTAQSFMKRHPDHPRVPATLNTVASCQLELGQKADARKTLDAIIKTYPNTKAAETAAAALSKIK